VMQSSVPPSNTLNRNASAARSAESSSVKLRSVGRKAWRGVRVCVCVYMCVCVCVCVCVWMARVPSGWFGGMLHQAHRSGKHNDLEQLHSTCGPVSPARTCKPLRPRTVAVCVLASGNDLRAHRTPSLTHSLHAHVESPRFHARKPPLLSIWAVCVVASESKATNSVRSEHDSHSHNLLMRMWNHTTVSRTS
jgi:hypothetical protein